MPTLVTTAGSATANSFASLTDFETYCDARLNASAWSDASESDQSRALIEATRDLNLLAYIGYPVTTTQALQWPRVNAIDPDQVWMVYFGTSTIPQRTINATCELALQYLKAGTEDVAALDPTLNVIEETVDVITTRYAAPALRVRGLRRYPRVWSYIAPLLSSPSSVTVPVLRG